jgi:sarcosine oxidase subunit delta
VPFLLSCPHCGPREATEFEYGGEVTQRPIGPSQPRRELSSYLYFRANAAGPQREWWFHSAGCGRWLIATRDTVTGAVGSVEAVSGQEAP